MTLQELDASHEAGASEAGVSSEKVTERPRSAKGKARKTSREMRDEIDSW